MGTDLIKRAREAANQGEHPLYDDLADALEAAERVVKPFADTVFNDNGDVTVSTSNLQINDYFAAYKWKQRL